MVDFRYHALSIVAVFLALGIGIVLGVTIGDSLVSDADRNLRDSLRDDVTEARQEARDAQDLGAKRDEVIDETAPRVAAGRLTGVRVALIAFDELPGSVADSVEESVRLGGGRLSRTAIVTAEDRQLAGRPRRLARLIETGGPRAQRLRRALPRRFSGNYATPVDALVVYRDPPADAEDDDEARALTRRERLEDAVLDGLRDNVVGVEEIDTDPSQVSWFGDRAVPSVDNVDTAAGHLALVLLVEDPRQEGAFGYKDSADAALPDLSD